jgi:hypothetical protein
VAVLLAGGCSGASPGTLRVDAPALTGPDRRTCAALVDALPDRVADQSARAVEGTGYAAAWGDPAIELRCGVPRPAGFGDFAQCQNANGVDWYIPDSQLDGEPTDITMTVVGRATYVEVRLPETYWPPVNAMVDLADAVKGTDRKVRPCL